MGLLFPVRGESKLFIACIMDGGGGKGKGTGGGGRGGEEEGFITCQICRVCVCRTRMRERRVGLPPAPRATSHKWYSAVFDKIEYRLSVGTQPVRGGHQRELGRRTVVHEPRHANTGSHLEMGNACVRNEGGKVN